MSLPKSEKIWHNGKFIAWDDAVLHVASHVVSYGSSLFEGARCYATERGPAVFRLREHMERLRNSCKIYRIELPYSLEELQEANLELIRVNKMQHCYLRPIVLRGYAGLSVNPQDNPIEVYLLCWKWGKYLGDEALKEGVDVCVSSWNRMAPNTLPAMAKAGANYMNAQLIKMEAVLHGYMEGIALDTHGYVSEGSGENIFVVKGDTIYTPPISSSVLPGITRDSIIRLAQDNGFKVVEQVLAREFLYVADEVFFTGTAVEVTPVRSIDRIQVGEGKPGPITRKLQDEFFAIVQGKADDRYGWLTYVHQPVAAAEKSS